MSDSAQKWRSAPRHLHLEPSSIHVWQGKYRFDPVQMKIFTASLSEEEKLRAKRFVKTSDHDRFVFAHGMLRSILGFYIGCPPHQITFGNSPYGKPALTGPAGADDIRFNLAHSRDVALVALCQLNDIGVDIEYLRAMPDLHQIIIRNFSVEERHYLDTIPADQLQRAFFAQWTLKESFIKGVGLGLSYPLEDFSIEPERARGEIGNLYTVMPKNGPRWNCQLLTPFSGYIGALASESILEKPNFWNY
jgi:4'-phosphopantetheinyl transferase